jgi:uncharacterized membrane protein
LTVSGAGGNVRFSVRSELVEIAFWGSGLLIAQRLGFWFGIRWFRSGRASYGRRIN